MALTRKQRAAVAAALISEAGTLLEFWAEKTADLGWIDGLDEVSADDAAECLADWLQRLPGNSWHASLPNR